MANAPIITPTPAPSTPPDGSVTPPKISAGASDDFTFPRDVAVGRNILLPQNASIEFAENFPSEDGVSINIVGSTVFFHDIHYNLDRYIFGMNNDQFTCNGTIKVGAAGSLNVHNDGYASAVLSADSTTQGFLPPRMTTTQRDAITSPAEGLVIYNLSTHKLNVFTTGWEQITSA